MVAATDNCVLVPVLFLEIAGFDELFLVRDFADDVFFAVFVDDHDIADVDEPASASFFVEEADGALSVHDIGLVAADDPFSEFLAAILDAAVAACEAELGFEDEVFGFAVTPDTEGVALGGVVRGGLASHGTIDNRPIPRVAVPAGEILAVEDGNETNFCGGFVSARDERRTETDEKEN